MLEKIFLGEVEMKKVLMLGVLFLCLVVSSCAKKQTVAPEDDEFGEDQEQTEQISDLEADC